MLISIQFGNKGLKFSKVVCKFLLALLQLVELGSCSRQGIRVTESIVKNTDNILNIGKGEGGASLDIGKNLGLRTALKSVEGIGHPQSWCREQCWVTEQLQPKLSNESFDLLSISIEHRGIGDLATAADGQHGGCTSTGRHIGSGGCFGSGRLVSIQYGLSQCVELLIGGLERSLRGKGVVARDLLQLCNEISRNLPRDRLGIVGHGVTVH